MNSKTILLIEDNPSDIELTKRAFEKGHIANALLVIEDGQEALEYLFCKGKYVNRDQNQIPALVLLDLKLPKIDGLEVLKRIRTAENLIKRVPVVVLTSSKEEQDVAASYDLGVNSYIRKPVDFNQFAESIKQLGLYWLIINEPPPFV
jgi:two-component system, response regulator